MLGRGEVEEEDESSSLPPKHGRRGSAVVVCSLELGPGAKAAATASSSATVVAAAATAAAMAPPQPPAPPPQPQPQPRQAPAGGGRREDWRRRACSLDPDSECVGLAEVLRSFGAPVTEAWAWALAYESCRCTRLPSFLLYIFFATGCFPESRA